jgi:hypothetical protein
MKVFKVTVSLIFSLLLGACSSTGQLTSNTEENHYYAKEFSHTEFTPHHKGSIKKSASSDHQLMLSLINRPVPADQLMMLAFAKRQESYFPDSAVVGVRIKGERIDHNNKKRTVSQYTHIIEQDNNSVSISAMPK